MHYRNGFLAKNVGLIQLQAINKKQMAEIMGISLSTLKRQLKSADLTVKRGLICPLRQEEIYQTLGWTRKASPEPK